MAGRQPTGKAREVLCERVTGVHWEALQQESARPAQRPAAGAGVWHGRGIDVGEDPGSDEAGQLSTELYAAVGPSAA